MPNVDTKPKRRLFEVLKSQGLQMNQRVEFLTDGGDTVRELPLVPEPGIRALAGLVPRHDAADRDGPDDQGVGRWRRPPPAGPAGDDGGRRSWKRLDGADAEKPLESLKWHLWHGNVYRALQIIEDLECDLESRDERSERAKKLLKAVSEFRHYIEANRASIPNYGDRYRHGEAIATSFAESTVNQVISKRMVKKQQMRWTERGAHRLLQVRTRVLNEDLRATFQRWYPGLKPATSRPRRQPRSPRFVPVS